MNSGAHPSPSSSCQLAKWFETNSESRVAPALLLSLRRHLASPPCLHLVMTTTLPAFLAQIGAAALAPTIVAPPAGSKGHLATLSDRIQAEIESVNVSSHLLYRSVCTPALTSRQDQTRELLASEWPEFRVQVQSGQELLARMGAEERDLAELEKVMSSEVRPSSPSSSSRVPADVGPFVVYGTPRAARSPCRPCDLACALGARTDSSRSPPRPPHLHLDSRVEYNSRCTPRLRRSSPRRADLPRYTTATVGRTARPLVRVVALGEG